MMETPRVGTARGKAARRYQVRFDRHWLTGRWGFTDRVFYDLGGRELEPKRISNTWVVQYKGTPGDLGRLLSQLLNIQAADHQRFGAIFEVSEISNE